MTGLIAQEWIAEHGGSENVVDVFAELLPGEDLYCLWDESPGRYPGRRVFESPLASSWLRNRKALALGMMSRQWRTLDVEQYDRALISSHAFAHHLGAGERQRHLERFVYVHSPARYVWAPEYDPRGRHPLAAVLRPYLRREDRKYVAPGHFAANSEFIRERIKAAWVVDATVIYPPVEVGALQQEASWAATLDASQSGILESLPREFILGASRFVEYKALDKVIDFGACVGLPVVLAGSGPLEGALRRHAEQEGVSVQFVPRPDNRLLRALYEAALVYVYPPVEDFGIMPVEAVALRTPIIVNEIGGAVETAALTQGGVTTSFTSSPEQAKGILEAAIDRDMNLAAKNARRFSRETFKSNVSAWLSKDNAAEEASA